MRGQNLPHEPVDPVDVGKRGHQAEEDDGAPVGGGIGRPRLVEVDVRGVGHHPRSRLGNLGADALRVERAAGADAVRRVEGGHLLAAQLPPVERGVEAAAAAAPALGELPHQLPGDLVRVEDQRRQRRAFWRLLQAQVREVGELEVDDVEAPALQQPIERGLELGHVVAVVLEAVAGGERAQLQHPLGQPAASLGIADEHHLAAVLAHGAAAFLEVELVVHQRDRGDVVVTGEGGHEPVHARLRSEAGRARGHLREVQDAEPGSIHRLAFTGVASSITHSPHPPWRTIAP